MKSSAYQHVTALLAAGRLAEGLNGLRTRRRELSPAEELECQGNVAFYNHEFQVAVSYYEQAMAIDKQYDVCRYHYLIGIQEEQSGQHIAAFERYQAAIVIEPDFVDAYVELGGLLFKTSDYLGAVQCFEDALSRSCTDLGVFQNLAAAYEQLARHDPTRFQEALIQARARYASAAATLPPVAPGHSW